MRVLVACEFSARVRDQFRALGHDAWSCDLDPTLGDPTWHIEDDVLSVLDKGWDLMVAFPPCTYLAVSGVRWLYEEPGRRAKMRKAAKFFQELLDAPVPLIAIENPIMHRYATQLIERKQDQIIHPYLFGHPEQKRTGLWLKGLPLLKSTRNVRQRMLDLPLKERHRTHYAAPGPDRGKLRSMTYPGIARAMARQWSKL